MFAYNIDNLKFCDDRDTTGPRDDGFCDSGCLATIPEAESEDIESSPRQLPPSPPALHYDGEISDGVETDTDTLLEGEDHGMSRE